MSSSARTIAGILVAMVVGMSAARAGTAGLAVGGDQAKAPELVAAATPWLQSHGWTLADHALDAKTSAKLVACFLGGTDDACAKPLVAKAGVDRFFVLLAEVTHNTKDGTDSIVVTGWIFGGDGTAITVERRYCDRCQKATLAQSTVELLDVLAKNTAGSGTLRVSTTPPGARVMVDGNAIGVTPKEYGVRAGHHKVTVDLSGYQIEAREVDVEEGKTADVDVTLVAIRPKFGKPVTPPPHGRGLWPWVLTGAGVAMLGGGGALIAMNDPQSSGTTGSRKKFYEPTLLPGAVLAGAGAVSLGIGIYLFIREPSRPRDAAGPQVAVTPDGVWLTYGGIF